jgi:hypothetical protein
MGVGGLPPQPGVEPLHPAPICRVCYLNWYYFPSRKGRRGEVELPANSPRPPYPHFTGYLLAMTFTQAIASSRSVM